MSENEPEIPEGKYDHKFIMDNPIPAQCVKCKRTFIDGELFRWHDGVQMRETICNDAIRAPTLANCLCFYCNGKLKPLDPESYKKRMAELPKYFIPAKRTIFQPPLF